MKVSFSFDSSSTTGFRFNSLRASPLTVLRVVYAIHFGLVQARPWFRSSMWISSVAGFSKILCMSEVASPYSTPGNSEMIRPITLATSKIRGFVFLTSWRRALTIFSTFSGVGEIVIFFIFYFF